MKFADFPLRGQGGGRGGKDIHYAFFGNVVRGKSALFWLVVRNGFAHYVRKVFAYRMLLPGKFWFFPSLSFAFEFVSLMSWAEKKRVIELI